MARIRPPTIAATLLASLAAFWLGACSAQAPTAAGTVAYIPDYRGGGEAAAGPPVQGYASPAPVVAVTLSETDPDHMSIGLSQSFAPTGQVSFMVSNTDTVKHEFVVLKSDTAADAFPIVSFEGEANRIDEDAKGVTNVGETGDMEPGAVMMLTLKLAPGHYAVVCNLPGHFASGMHQDFFVTPAGATLVA
jgi:uncharacterized cupredoxin-like copper-binding protein